MEKSLNAIQRRETNTAELQIGKSRKAEHEVKSRKMQNERRETERVDKLSVLSGWVD